MRAAFMFAGCVLIASGAAAQKPPQIGPAINQALAGMAAAQNALEQLASQPQIARQAAADDVVKAALAELQKQASALQGAVSRLQSGAAPAAAALDTPGAAPAAAAQPDPVTVCRAQNVKLLAVGHDILHLYETQSFRRLLLGSYEPLLGLHRVELENIVQDNDDRLRDQEFFPPAKP